MPDPTNGHWVFNIFPAFGIWHLPFRPSSVSGLLQLLALPRCGVPTEDAVLLHGFEREQAWQRRVVPDFERRVGGAVLGLQLVEEIARVDVERIVLLHRAARVDRDVQLD